MNYARHYGITAVMGVFTLNNNLTFLEPYSLHFMYNSSLYILSISIDIKQISNRKWDIVSDHICPWTERDIQRCCVRNNSLCASPLLNSPRMFPKSSSTHNK